jgi:hypothetical protein
VSESKEEALLSSQKPERLTSHDVARMRKMSVFNVAGRMLNNLMGRNSLPPDLPSTYTSKSQPSSPVGTSSAEGTTAFSFKKVFKKRSV